MKTLNELYSSGSTRRRYEVWFVRLGLADGSGAWWFRYLLMNPGRGGCPGDRQGMPVQVWATWFPRNEKPQTFVQGFRSESLELSRRGQNPFHFRIGNHEIDENSCRGKLESGGHSISWNLHYRSTFRFTMSNKGWIGFSRTPHSDALFSGQILLDERSFARDTLGLGVQGHNCGYRHRNFWTWAHAYFPRSGGHSTSLQPTTLEALIYEMPFGMIFRKVVLWHEGEVHEFKDLQEIRRERDELAWNFRCSSPRKSEVRWQLEAAINGAGPSIHRLPYLKTDCTGSFEVANNSLARAVLRLERAGKVETFETSTGAVLEMVGN